MTVIDKNTNKSIKIKSKNYNPELYDLHTTNSVYVYNAKNKLIKVTKQEYRKNKYKYKLSRKTDILNVFNLKKLDWETISIKDYDKKKHITTRSEFVKIYFDNELIDICLCSSIRDRYKESYGIPSKIIKSYKQNKNFFINNKELKAIKINPKEKECFKHYKTFLNLRPIIFKEIICIYDNNNIIKYEVDRQNVSSFLSKHDIPRNLFYKSLSKDGDYKFYCNTNKEKPYKGWYVKHQYIIY